MAPDKGTNRAPDATAEASREAARDDDYERAQQQVKAAEEAHEKGDIAAGAVEEWPGDEAETNPVAPGKKSG